MDKFSVLKTRLNAAFGIISLFTAVSVLIRAVVDIVKSISSLIIKEFSLASVSETFDFYVSFILPQFLLPLLTVAVAFLIPIFGSYKIKPCIKSEKVPAVYFILCIGIFPGLTIGATIVSYLISEILVSVGIPVLNIASVVPETETPLQIFWLILVMAVLPAICEEIIYRGFLLRGIAEFGKNAAMLVSSFAFGLMHANLQQIPFAFLIGLFLSYITLRFKSIVLSVILHFINNFIACSVLILSNYLDSELVDTIDAYLSLSFIVISILCTIVFIVLTKREKARAGIKDISQSEAPETSTQILACGKKVNFLQAVIHSWGFWLFTAVYSFSTIVNVLYTA